MASRGRAPSPVVRSLRKIVLASCAMHSSRPFLTAAAMDASPISSSLSSPMVTVPRGALGLYLGGRGMSSALTSLFTSLPSSSFTPRGPAGGLGPSCPASALTRARDEPPAGVKGVLRESSSSCLTPPMLGGCDGGCGASPSSSRSSCLMAERSACGANLRRKTRRRSSWPLRIRTAALASTVPESARMNSWYCSTLPHSVSRALTAARNVEAETSSCSVGAPGGKSSISSTSKGSTGGGTLGPAFALAFLTTLGAGRSTASSNLSTSLASRSRCSFMRCLKRSTREAGTAAAPGSESACQTPARETCLAGASAAFCGGFAGAALAAFGGPAEALAALDFCFAKRDGCVAAVGSSACGRSMATFRRSASMASSSRDQPCSGSSVHQCKRSS
mmetsp:Transcript_69504/g.224854  ORF Transcript_69504/g.224854 Transcript_69504/m.224854 type:complete len:391 (+) Transcript_69504:827-1999(+)